MFTAGAAYSLYVVYEWATAGFATVPVARVDIAAFTACVTGLQLVLASFLLNILADATTDTD